MTQRLIWLDTFRGLCIILTLLCRDLSTRWQCLFHTSTWHGFQIADILPAFFLYISGVALSKSTDTHSIHQTLTRLILFVITGFLLEGRQNPQYLLDLSTIRIPGSLQRLAIASLPLVFINHRYSPSTRLFMYIIYTISFLLLYHILAHTFHTCVHESDKWSPACNAVINIDSTLFGLNHLHSNPTYYTAVECSVTTPCALFSAFAPAYCRRSFDSYGVMSTINAVPIVLIAAITHSSSLPVQGNQRLAVFLFHGVMDFLVMFIDIPVNSSLNTPTFVIYATSMAATFASVLQTITSVSILRFLLTPITVIGRYGLLFFVLGGTGLVEELLELVMITRSKSALDFLKEYISIRTIGWADPLISFVFFKILCMTTIAMIHSNYCLKPFRLGQTRGKGHRLGGTKGSRKEK